MTVTEGIWPPVGGLTGQSEGPALGDHDVVDDPGRLASQLAGSFPEATSAVPVPQVETLPNHGVRAAKLAMEFTGRRLSKLH